MIGEANMKEYENTSETGYVQLGRSKAIFSFVSTVRLFQNCQIMRKLFRYNPYGKKNNLDFWSIEMFGRNKTDTG